MSSDRPILTFYNRYRYRLFIVYLTDNRYSEPIFIYCYKVNKSQSEVGLRTTVILVLSRNNVTSLAHHGTVPHRPLDCFYSNTNKFVQIEDTKIKTERGC